MDESTDHDVEGELAASDLFDHLKVLLELLSPRQREVFILSRKENLTYKEIAERLEISEKTVERHMGDALKFLRRNLLLYSVFFSF